MYKHHVHLYIYICGQVKYIDMACSCRRMSN